jgi:hypothetical protein
MRGHVLGVFEGAAGFKASRDPGRPKGMTADPEFHAKPRRAALDHPPRVDAVHRFLSQRAGPAGGGSEEGSLARLPRSRRALCRCRGRPSRLWCAGISCRLPPFSCSWGLRQQGINVVGDPPISARPRVVGPRRAWRRQRQLGRSRRSSPRSAPCRAARPWWT